MINSNAIPTISKGGAIPPKQATKKKEMPTGSNFITVVEQQGINKRYDSQDGKAVTVDNENIYNAKAWTVPLDDLSELKAYLEDNVVTNPRRAVMYSFNPFEINATEDDPYRLVNHNSASLAARRRAIEQTTGQYR